MIVIGAQIQRLAYACLVKLFENLRTAHNAILPAEWLENPRRGSAPFQWIEEFRVYRALWLLQIHSDLRRALKADQESDWGGWNWTPTGVDKIATESFGDSIALDHEVQGFADVLIDIGRQGIIYARTTEPAMPEGK
ncbi:hypothetical protein BDW69DRAFT_182232 [Aspergillus filifer]